MAHYLVQVILEHDSALPEDRAINTWSFSALTARDDALALLINDELTDFYQAIGGWLSAGLSGNATIKFYDRSDASPRSPFFENTFVFTPGEAARLPEEVALCLSFKAAVGSGVPPARARGRVFLGPLNTTTLNIGEADNGSRPELDFLGAVRGAAIDFLAASVGAGNWSWEVWSTVDNVGREVVAGWVDNAFDTQRRRGLSATDRLVW